MELFIPSVLILLLAAAVIFFVLPRFGAATLAIISVALLVFGVYQHMNSFGTEYRLSTWQLGLMSYAPYIMIGGLLLVIGFYLVSISPLGKANTTAPTMPEMPSIAEMPNANSATNAVTAGVNNALKGITNVAGNAAAAIGMGNAAKANNKGVGNALAAPAVAAVNQAAAAANTAVNGVTKAANSALTGLTNAVSSVANTLTGNKPRNNRAAGNAGLALGLGGNKGMTIPPLKFPLSQI
jgi:hypothetical protein